MISPVHLRSKGGSVEEAMKMGAIIRRLRLETEVPVWDTGRPPVDRIRSIIRRTKFAPAPASLSTPAVLAGSEITSPYTGHPFQELKRAR